LKQSAVTKSIPHNSTSPVSAWKLFQTNVPDALARRVIVAAEHAKVELAAMSGTFNYPPFPACDNHAKSRKQARLS